MVAWGSILLSKVLALTFLRAWYIVLLRCYIRKAFALSISGRGGRLGRGWKGEGVREVGEIDGYRRGSGAFESHGQGSAWLFNSLLYLRCISIVAIEFPGCRLYHHYYSSCCGIFGGVCGCGFGFGFGYGLSCLMLDIWLHVAQYETDIRVRCFDVGLHVRLSSVEALA